MRSEEEVREKLDELESREKRYLEGELHENVAMTRDKRRALEWVLEDDDVEGGGL